MAKFKEKADNVHDENLIMIRWMVTWLFEIVFQCISCGWGEGGDRKI